MSSLKSFSTPVLVPLVCLCFDGVGEGAFAWMALFSSVASSFLLAWSFRIGECPLLDISASSGSSSFAWARDHRLVS